MQSRMARFCVRGTMDHVAVQIRGTIHMQPQLRPPAPTSDWFCSGTIIMFLVLVLVVAAISWSFVPCKDSKEIKNRDEKNIEDLKKDSDLVINMPRIERSKLEIGWGSHEDGYDSWYWDILDDRKRNYSEDLNIIKYHQIV